MELVWFDCVCVQEEFAEDAVEYCQWEYYYNQIESYGLMQDILPYNLGSFHRQHDRNPDNTKHGKNRHTQNMHNKCITIGSKHMRPDPQLQ